MAKDTLIIITGGTIDAEAYPDPKHPPKNATMLDKSLIPITVAGMKGGERCDCLEWKSRDSKDFLTADIRELAKIIRSSQAKNIIITHGTDAMPHHARQLESMLLKRDVHMLDDAFAKAYSGAEAVRGKRVVFTGAMMPLANGKESDGYKNLEYIFTHMDSWQPGVRAVMHERSYKPEGLRKNMDTYVFEGTVIPDAPARGRA